MMGVCMKCGLRTTYASRMKGNAISPTLPVWGPSVAPMVGCICPPGANLTCENPMCPRKPPQPMRAVGTA